MQQTRHPSEATEAAGPEVANKPTPGAQSLDTILQQLKDQLEKQQAAASSADKLAKSLQIESSVRPVVGVDTSVAAFVGLTLTGPRTATPWCRDHSEWVTIRVALIDLPGLLAAVILDAFANEPDINVEVLPAGSSPTSILASHPNIVMVGIADPPNYSFPKELLHERPELGLFAISPDGRQAWIHEMCLRSRPLAEVSGSSLRDAVRAIASRGQR